MRAVRRAARPTTISMTWRGRGRPRRRPGSTGPSPPCAASTRSWGSDGGTARHVRLLPVPPRPRRVPVPATAAGPHRRDADRPRRAGRRLSGGRVLTTDAHYNRVAQILVEFFGRVTGLRAPRRKINHFV